jgi:hypothetical protein
LQSDAFWRFFKAPEDPLKPAAVKGGCPTTGKITRVPAFQIPVQSAGENADVRGRARSVDLKSGDW